MNMFIHWLILFIFSNLADPTSFQNCRTSVSCTLTHWSLGAWRCGSNFKHIIFQLIIRKVVWTHEIALRWMLKNLTNDISTLVQVMAWCRQAPSYCLSQCWPWSMSLYDITRPQWVNWLWWTVGICYYLTMVKSTYVIWHHQAPMS